eukprot:PhM_4_TR2879/c0_g2_i1/m.889
MNLVRKNDRHTFLLLLLLLLLLVALLIVGVTAAENVYFGQSAALTGVWTPAIRFNAGIRAAFKESNDRGGIYGRIVHLITMDDQLNDTLTRSNIQTLLNNPNVISILSPTGTSSTEAALSVCTPQNVPIIAPLTGAEQLRTNFTKYAINLRAGYSDEILMMFKIFATYKQLKRVCLAYQDDDFGRPAATAIISGLDYLQISSDCVLHYTPTADGIMSYDYQAGAQQIFNAKAHVFIFFTQAMWSNTLLDAYYALNPNSTMLLLTGSWNGNDNRDHFKAKGYNPSNLVTTQVVPHPEQVTSASATNYRKALVQHEGVVNGQFDFMSFEGYIAGRLALEILSRTYTLSRQDYLQAIYGTRLFTIDEITIGPFSDDCRFQTGITTNGRSAMCNCSQGMKYVSTTTLDANYDFHQAMAILYDIEECYDTSNSIRMPVRVGISELHNSSSSTAFEIGLETAENVAHMSFYDLDLGEDVSYIKASSLHAVHNSTYLISVLGTLPVEPQDDFVVFCGLTSYTVHAGQVRLPPTQDTTDGSFFPQRTGLCFPDGGARSLLLDIARSW